MRHPCEFSLTRAHAEQIAELYQVPSALEDTSKNPEDYRTLVVRCLSRDPRPSAMGEDNGDGRDGQNKDDRRRR